MRSTTKSSPFHSSLSTALAAISLSAGMLGIGLWLPLAATPEASSKTYEPAFWNYDPSVSHFDNSPWSYFTDYVIAVGMVAYITSVLFLSQPGTTDRLCIRVAFLASMCLMSVACGGLCHQFYIRVWGTSPGHSARICIHSHRIQIHFLLVRQEVGPSSPYFTAKDRR